MDTLNFNNPNMTVLLYSKYSEYSKQLMDMIKSSGIDFANVFAVHSLCVDNELVRQRIIKNKQIDITTVPCILTVYPNGTIEKYDGIHVFNWVNDLVSQYQAQYQAQLPQPQPRPEPQPQLEQHQKFVESPKELKQKKEEENIQQYEEFKKRSRAPQNQAQLDTKHTHNRKLIDTNIENTSKPAGSTSIDDLPSDEEDDHNLDRFRARKPKKSIRSDSGNYTEDEQLFEGRTPDMRKGSASAVKTGIKKSEKKSIMALAKEMEKSRESVGQKQSQ